MSAKIDCPSFPPLRNDLGCDHAIDHLEGMRHRPAFVQGVHDLLPEARQCPTPKLSIDAGPFPKLCRQVPPRNAGTGNPENPIKNKAWLVGLRPLDARADRMNRSKNALSFTGKTVPQTVLWSVPFRLQDSGQTGLHCRYQIASCSKPDMNPFCQHGLGGYSSRQYLSASPIPKMSSTARSNSAPSGSTNI